jgi:cobalt-zinc-cadmium efflux system outer membrane protein
MILRLCLAVTLCAAAAAQTSLSLRDALDLALKTHPALATAEQRIAVTQGARIQAGLAPNPKLILQSENTRPYSGTNGFVFWRDTDDFAYLQNTFETGGKRQRRVEVAEGGVRRTELERELARLQIASRVALAYWQAAGAQLQHELLAETGRTMQQIVEYHEIRVKEGAMAEADLIRVRLEAQRLAIATNQALLDAERGRIQLYREMGQAEFPAVRINDPIDSETISPAVVDPASALEQRPEMKLARLSVEVSRANVRLQQAVAKPNLDVVFGYKRTAGLDTMIGGLQVDLPFRNRNQGAVAQATAEVRVVESNLAATQALVRAEVQAALADFDLRRKQMAALLGPLVAQAEETYRIADAAYREGGTDLLRLLDAQRVRIEARISYTRALAELRQSQVALRAALGEMP